MVGQVHVNDDLFAQLSTHVSRDALDLCEEINMFFDCHQGEDRVFLRTVANQFTNGLELTDNIHLGDRDISGRWQYITCETPEGSRFSSTVNSEECEALAVIDTKRDPFDCQKWVSDKAGISFTELGDSDHVFGTHGLTGVVIEGLFFASDLLIDDIVIKVQVIVTLGLSYPFAGQL